MLDKIQKRIEKEIAQIIKKSTLSFEEYNILFNERHRLLFLKEQETNKKYTNELYEMTKSLMGSVCNKAI